MLAMDRVSQTNPRGGEQYQAPRAQLCAGRGVQSAELPRVFP